MGRVEERVAIVTGAAGALGRACALALAREGARVMASDSDEAGARETVAAIEAAGGTAAAFRHDMTVEDDWRRLTDTTLNLYHRLDILAHTVHVHVERPLASFSLGEFRALEHVNIQGPWLGLKSAGPAMRVYGHGAIAIVSSSLGIAGRADAGAASLAGAAVRVMVRSAAAEFATRDPKVRVNAVLADPAYFALQPEAAASGPASDGALSPYDVAHAVLHCVSDEARFMTGADLVVERAQGAA